MNTKELYLRITASRWAHRKLTKIKVNADRFEATLDADAAGETGCG